MSFDLWSRHYMNKYGKIDDIFQCQEAWNAAIEECINKILKMSFPSNIELICEFRDDLIPEIQKLKTE